MSKIIQVSKTLAEALSLANTKPFEEGAVDNNYKIYGTIKPSTIITPLSLQQYIKLSEEIK